MLKSNIFKGARYKWWHQRCILWFTVIHCYFVVEHRSPGPHTVEEERVFQDTDTIFKKAIIDVLGNCIVDLYVTMMSTGKETWDTLEAKYWVSNAGSEL